MVTALPDILSRIVSRKREEVDTLVRDGLEARAAQAQAARRDFRAALAACRPAIIAEVKKASPSKGVLQADFDPARLAKAYEEGGAAALSVLTDGPFFQGSLADLAAARAVTELPALRKDFTIDPVQVLEAAAHGADAILLIVAILTERQLRDYRELAARYGMAALVEVHSDAELEVALASGAEIVGVNNRDLRTFRVTLETSLRLAGRIPDHVVKVSESGMESAADVRRLMDAGFQAFLVGEHLMRSGAPADALRRLRSAP